MEKRVAARSASRPFSSAKPAVCRRYMQGIRCCLYIDTDPKYTMEFYHDDKGNHLGTVTENGHENFPFPDEEPFASCFADKMDMSKCRPVSPEELAELNRTLGAEYNVNFKS